MVQIVDFQRILTNGLLTPVFEAEHPQFLQVYKGIAYLCGPFAKYTGQNSRIPLEQAILADARQSKRQAISSNAEIRGHDSFAAGNAARCCTIAV